MTQGPVPVRAVVFSKYRKVIPIQLRLQSRLFFSYSIKLP